MNIVNNYGMYHNASYFKGSDSKSHNVFDYIPKEIINQTRDKMICPNSMVSASISLRNNEHLYHDDSLLVRAVDEAFEKLPGTTQNQTFWRGLYGIHLDKEFLNSREGDIVMPDKGYAQLGLDRYYAERYLPSQSCMPVLLEMICPKGSKVSMISKNTGTGCAEALMPRGAKFKVLKKEVVKYPPVSIYDDEKSVLKYTLEYINEG